MRTTVIRATKTAGFLLLATFTNPLIAQTTTDYDEGWYVGGNIGISTSNIDENRITKNLTNPSYTDDEEDLGYKLFGGYQFNKNFAIEGGYFDLGKFDYSLYTNTGTAEGDLKVRGVNLDAVLTLPITKDFSAFGRVGANYAQTKDSFSSTGTISITDPNPKKTDLNYKFGAGLQYAVTDAVGVRLEAERYHVNDAVGNKGDIDLFSIGLTYRFGVTKKSAPVSEPQEKVAPVSEPQEKVAPVSEEKDELIVITAPDAQEKIRESAAQKKTVALVFEDIHFEFDKSVLNNEAKDALKKDIAQLGENTNFRMLVAGHTSKSGTEQYNQKLSERRAHSVKDFLIQEKLVPADKISIIGYGETRPAQYEINPADIYSKAAKANMRVSIEVNYE